MTDTQVFPRITEITQRKVYAIIKGIQYPVELLGTRKENGLTIFHVRVLPDSGGFTPRPFLSCTYSAPFVNVSEGEVLEDAIKVVYL
jgi:hypothetical protein